MSVMEDLDGDGGATRDELVARVADEYGASEDEVEDAIQDALMDGRCYEPDEETLKPI
jgi:division protein CdvB (Snf7/Vps24/ESCRT-III family)